MFTPTRSFQDWCSPECAVKIAKFKLDKKLAKEKTQDKHQTRAQLEALKTIPMLKREAQTSFNAWIRARSKAEGHVCISCGSELDWDGRRGGMVDAGHLRSVGAADHLRYNPDNCWAQCKHCNRDLSGNVIAYRMGLVQRIGLARVETLENNNEVHKWTRDELRCIREIYRSKIKEFA
jgi:hypothetical protein